MTNFDVRTKIGEGGRIVIPPEYRKVLGVKPGDEVILHLDQGGIRLLTAQQAIQCAQAIVRRHVSEDRSLVDELIRERRQEAPPV